MGSDGLLTPKDRVCFAAVAFVFLIALWFVPALFEQWAVIAEGKPGKELKNAATIVVAPLLLFAMALAALAPKRSQ